MHGSKLVQGTLIKSINIHTYGSSENGMTKLFHEAGLEIEMDPFSCGLFKSHILKHIIVHRKILSIKVNLLLQVFFFRSSLQPQVVMFVLGF